MFNVVVSLFVLAAAIIAVLALTVGVSDKPATERPRHRRARPAPEPLASPAPQSPPGPRPAPAAPPEVPEAPATGPRRVTVDVRSRGRQARSAVLLVTLLVVLGTVVAVVVAAAMALLGLSLRDAVT